MSNNKLSSVLIASLFGLVLTIVPSAYAAAPGSATDGIDVECSDYTMVFAPLADSGDCVQLAYIDVNDQTQLSVDALSELVIPSQVESNGKTYSVTAVGYKAEYGPEYSSSQGTTIFASQQDEAGNYYDDMFEKVSIPASVETIGSAAFMKWENLSAVDIAENSHLKSIGYKAFGSCAALKSFNIPDGVEDLGGTNGNVFSFSGLTEIAIPSSVRTIGNQCFDQCEELTKVTIADNAALSEIPMYCFSRCNKLKYFDFGVNNSISIGESAFEDCGTDTNPASGHDALTDVRNWDSVTKIGDRAFWNCQVMTGPIESTNNLVSVGYAAFYNCQSLTEVTLGPRCGLIGDLAFYNNLKLADINICFSGETLYFGNPDGKVNSYGKVFSAPQNSAQGKKLSPTMTFLGNIGHIEDVKGTNGSGSATTFGADNKNFLMRKLAVRGRCESIQWFFTSVQNNPPKWGAQSADTAITYELLPSLNDSDVSVGEIGGVEFTGEAITPELTITVGADEETKTLVKGEDYNLVYSNNIQPGTATIEIQGIGDTYQYDSRKVTFEIIEPAAVTEALAKIAAIGEVTSLDQQAAVEAARAAYDAITNEAQKALIGDEQVDVLKAAETQVKILGLEKQIADANDASVVGSLANQLAAAQAELDAVQTELGKTKADAEAAAAAAKADLDAAQAKISSAKTDQKLKVAKAQKTKTVKAKKAKKKAVKTSKVKISGAKTKLTYAKVSGSEKLSISTSGKIKVKKGTKKGTYKIKVLVVAKSSAKYNAAITTVTIKVKVK